MNTASDRELLELIAAQVGKLTNELSEFKKETAESFSKVNIRLGSIDNRIIIIENDHGKKLDALLDGYKQLAEGQVEIRLKFKSFHHSKCSKKIKSGVLHTKQNK